ncbi:MAG: hypothetical protein R3F23_01735 [Verrucomicrobiia bacterium]
MTELVNAQAMPLWKKVVMAIQTRPDIYQGIKTNIRTREIVKLSRLVSRMQLFSATQ